MICKNCGAEIDDNSTFCAKCGCRIKKDNAIEIDAPIHFFAPVNTSIYCIIAGYLGIFSILGIFAPFAIIFGILGIKDVKKKNTHGIFRAYFGIFFGALFLVIYAMLFLS